MRLRDARDLWARQATRDAEMVQMYEGLVSSPCVDDPELAEGLAKDLLWAQEVARRSAKNRDDCERDLQSWIAKKI